MSDVDLLFLVLVLIYVWECAFWLPRGSSVFRTWFGKRWRLLHPGVLLGNQKGGFLFGQPFPPLGTLLAAGESPVLLSPEGVSNAQMSDLEVPPFAMGRHIGWEQIETVVVRGKKIFLNRELFLKADSPLLAIKIRGILLEMRQSKPKDRKGIICNHLNETFNTSRIEDRWREFKNATRLLPFATNALFAYLFIFAPILIDLFGFRRCWLILLAGVVALTSAVAVSFHRAHKTLFPGAEEERFTHFIIILLSPATAIRSRDVLSRPLVEAFHPLAVSKVFCPPELFREQAGNYVRQGRYRASEATRAPKESPAKEIERYWRVLRQTTFEDFLRREGLDPEQLVQPPIPVDETCLSYCPCCRAQFTTGEGVCHDCGGLALLPLQSIVRPGR